MRAPGAVRGRLRQHLPELLCRAPSVVHFGEILEDIRPVGDVSQGCLQLGVDVAGPQAAGAENVQQAHLAQQGIEVRGHIPLEVRLPLPAGRAWDLCRDAEGVAHRYRPCGPDRSHLTSIIAANPKGTPARKVTAFSIPCRWVTISAACASVITRRPRPAWMP